MRAVLQLMRGMLYSQIEYIKSDKNRQARKSWLWVCAMPVIYGLRPSEIASAKKSHRISGDRQN